MYPAEVLRQPAIGLTEISDDVVKLVEDMFEAMYVAPGVGLAAPQVNRSLRLFVMDSRPDDQRHPIAMINPSIIKKEGEITWDEGCLSIPGFYAEVTRAESVTVSALDVHGNEQQYDLTGFEAVIAQHEIDHLDGVLFVDYLSNMRRRLFEKDYGKDRFRYKFKSRS